MTVLEYAALGTTAVGSAVLAVTAFACVKVAKVADSILLRVPASDPVVSAAESIHYHVPDIEEALRKEMRRKQSRGAQFVARPAMVREVGKLAHEAAQAAAPAPKLDAPADPATTVITDVNTLRVHVRNLATSQVTDPTKAHALLRLHNALGVAAREYRDTLAAAPAAEGDGVTGA